MNIQEMEGRELAETVATEVMEWTALREPGKAHLWMPPEHFISGWRPDRDIAAAMQVVEKMQKPNWAWHMESVYVNNKLMWFVTFWGDENGELITNDGAEEETLTLAICRAALMAAEAE